MEMETGSKREEKLFETVKRVLGLEMLLDMILDYVIHGESKKEAISNIRSSRLVCKDWLHSVSRILLKCQEPLFRFHVTRSDNQTGELLDAFVGPSRLHDRVPPFSIRAQDIGILFQEHRQSFTNCLVNCGSGLVALRLAVQDANAEVSLKLNADFLLPKLKKLTVKFRRNTDQNSVIIFIQSLLDTCKQLKYCNLQGMTANNYPASAFTFPSSITKLRLQYLFIDDENLNALEKNLVPTLKKLQLHFAHVPLKEGIITSILEKVRQTLKSLDIRIYLEDLFSVTGPVTFRLPLMEKLESLEISTENLELERNSSSLEKFVPVVSHMNLSNQTASAFRKWTDSSCFSSVTSLKTSLSLIEIDYIRERGFSQENFSRCAMESMKRAFPNLQKLDIGICETDTLVPVFIMKEMTRLQHLRIAHHYRGVRGAMRPQFWEALLLGLSQESAVALKKNPILWENNLERESTVSIRNMTDLQYLHLDIEHGFVSDTFELSSAVFTHAFFKMPQLTHLILDYHFSVPEEMKQLWISQGRSLNAMPRNIIEWDPLGSEGENE